MHPAVVPETGESDVFEASYMAKLRALLTPHGLIAGHLGHRQTQPLPLLHLLHPQPVRHLALDAPRLQADVLDQAVLQTISSFYRDRTDLIITAVDKILLEERIDKLSVELTQLRRRRDELQLLIDTAPEEITTDQLATFADHINRIINDGTDAERKQLCDLLIEELRINNPSIDTATPVFRIDLTATATVTNTKSAPTSKLAGAPKPSSQGVRERRPQVARQELEP
jgi:hypothetical protein